MLRKVVKNRYCVFRVLEPPECAAARELVWRFLEGLGTGIDRDDPTSFGDARWPHEIPQTGTKCSAPIHTACL